MNTLNTQFQRVHGAILATLIFLVSLMVGGCQLKCPVPTERQKSVTSTPWRLVETNDPEFQQYINKETQQFTYTFLVWSFTQTFTGDIKLVQNNTQYDQPVRTLVYDINPYTHQMLIKFAFPGGGTGNSSTESSSGDNKGDSPVLYSYDLSNILQMVSEKGYSYRFVPFTGVIAPDDTCVF